MGESVLRSKLGTANVPVPQVQGSIEKAAEMEIKDSADYSSSSSFSVVRWENFLPKMVVRVLLVEADDSTRQIIAALLRKCSYRVAAVGDGLKAWELLKRAPHNIDLILTEVELPSISGYALLSLIMEHDVCKNIPVIMLSSHDSISTVYKCMLRGATDFLVKPIRTNELRNLWQHVWRKQASNPNTTCPGPGPPDESVARPKLEATAENKHIIEKGSDAMSSCDESELENDRADTENCVAHPNSIKSTEYDIHLSMNEERDKKDEKIIGPDDDSDLDAREPVGLSDQNFEVKTTPEKNSSREVIDLIGGFNKEGFETDARKATTTNFDVMTMLDLSLNSSNASGSANQNNYGRPKLNHSDASAFSWYVNKPLQSCHIQQRDHETNYEKPYFSHNPDHDPKTHGPTLSSEKHVSVATILPQVEISQSIPVSGARFEQAVDADACMMPSYCSPSGLSRSNTSWKADFKSDTSQQSHKVMDQRISDDGNKLDKRQDHELENLEDPLHVRHPVRDQSGNSNTHDGYMTHNLPTGSGNDGKINTVSAVRVASESGSEEGSFHIIERSSHRSLLREAALTKFRMKRKDRCFEKKVRYESRKKLAEQRPRVKGQFVRQAPNDPQSG